ncbi:MAG: cupin domain-containing protein [Anaerolineae bacterium]|nr:cupin domain-containing protein [Anaerolineae bacterium]
MTALKYDELPVTHVNAGTERRLGHTDNLMIVIVDFTDGPKAEPDPPHRHPHEQVSYIAEGEVIFVLGEEKTHLKPGDIVVVPSNVPHSVQVLTERARLVDCFTPIREDFLT